GHFYNGRKGLGAAFLAGELAIGATALGLFIKRVSHCDRLSGYQAGSLYCEGLGREEGVALRNAEQTFGILFLGSLALDVVLAQALFRPYATVKRTRVRRSELGGASDDAGKGAKPPAAGKERPGAPSSRLRSSDIRQVAPAFTLVPGGGGLGVEIRF